MRNEPTREELKRLPSIHAVEHQPRRERILYMHLHLGKLHWYVAGFEDDVCSGYIVDENSDTVRWGDFDLNGLRKYLRGGSDELERDIEWTPRKASEVKRIREWYRSGR